MEENNEQAHDLPSDASANPPDASPRVVVVLLVLVGALIGGAAIGGVLSILIARLAGWDEVLLAGHLAPDAPSADRWALRIVLGINHLTTFILGGLAVVLLYYRKYLTRSGWVDWRDYLGLKNTPTLLVAALSCLLMLVAAPLVLYLYNINQALPIPEALRTMESQTNDAIKGLLQMENVWELLANLVVIALLPAIGEEIVFRGVVQKQLQRFIRNPWVVILVSGAVFSFVHLQFEGFLPRLLLGMLLGWLYWRSGSLWVSAIAHFFNNAIQVVGQYLYSSQLSAVDLEKDVNVPWYVAAISLVLVIYLIRTMRFPELLKRWDQQFYP